VGNWRGIRHGKLKRFWHFFASNTDAYLTRIYPDKYGKTLDFLIADQPELATDPEAQECREKTGAWVSARPGEIKRVMTGGVFKSRSGMAPANG
jgi:hypothetical protein